MQGHIKWYRPSDQTGYIVGSNGLTYYFDNTCFLTPVNGVLPAGLPVSFTAERIIDRDVAVDICQVK